MLSMFSRRVIAYIADFFVISAFMWIVSFLLYVLANPIGIYTIYSFFPYIIPILCIVYFTYCEKTKGATVGKALMYLRVVTYRGYNISWSQAFVRSLTKIYYVPIIFDWLIGKILKKDRILNVITKTVVVDERKYDFYD